MLLNLMNMTYTSWFEPLMLIFLTLILGFLIGTITTLWVTMKENKAINEELNARNREIRGWGDRYKKQTKELYQNDFN